MTTPRTYPPAVADEVTTLLAFLDFYRDTLRRQSDGLTAAQMGTTLGPSSLTLGGLLKHLAGDGLDTLAVREKHGKHPSLRWILVHMVEEYARHCGHADLIRESIDGAVDL